MDRFKSKERERSRHLLGIGSGSGGLLLGPGEEAEEGLPLAPAGPGRRPDVILPDRSPGSGGCAVAGQGEREEEQEGEERGGGHGGRPPPRCAHGFHRTAWLVQCALVVGGLEPCCKQPGCSVFLFLFCVMSAFVMISRLAFRTCQKKKGWLLEKILN